MVLYVHLEEVLNDSTFGFIPLSKQLRDTLHAQPHASITAAFQSATAALERRIVAQVDSMPIYRLGDLLLHAPFNSPIFLVLTFEFLLGYLHEVNGVSIGHRYFDSHPHVQYITKLRRRLVEASEFHTDSGNQGPPVEDRGHHTTASLLWTAALWLEEPRVHDVQAELAFLPPQYGPELLVRIRSRIKEDWYGLADLKPFQTALTKHGAAWRGRFTQKSDEMEFGYLFMKNDLVQVAQPAEGEESRNSLDLTLLNDQLPNTEYLLSCDIRILCSPLIRSRFHLSLSPIRKGPNNLSIIDRVLQAGK